MSLLGPNWSPPSSSVFFPRPKGGPQVSCAPQFSETEFLPTTGFSRRITGRLKPYFFNLAQPLSYDNSQSLFTQIYSLGRASHL